MYVHITADELQYRYGDDDGGDEVNVSCCSWYTIWVTDRC